MEIVPKISVKTVVGMIPRPAENAPRRLIMRIVGRVVGKPIEKETAYGTSLCFTGDFMATNLETGEDYRSPKAYLPGVIEGIVAAGVGVGENNVEFAFDIGVEPSAKGMTGYAFYVESLMAPAENDPLLALVAALPEVKRLAA